MCYVRERQTQDKYLVIAEEGEMSRVKGEDEPCSEVQNVWEYIQNKCEQNKQFTGEKKVNVAWKESGSAGHKARQHCVLAKDFVCQAPFHALLGQSVSFGDKVTVNLFYSVFGVLICLFFTIWH